MKKIKIIRVCLLTLLLTLSVFCFVGCSKPKEGEEYTFSPLKIAVFADVQLTTASQDATVNAYTSLKNQFKYAKSINADVLLMNGDVVNNAVENYYNLYWRAFTQVYGEDESAYPEFVMNMGNHEWWDLNEKDTANCVSLFKKYARIESPNLVKVSATPYYLDKNSTLPTYYKVIKGVPFLVISGENSSGRITGEYKTEISNWLKEIAQLPSVKQGGPIYVAYHCPLAGVTYDGEHAQDASKAVIELLQDYPNAIVFTGDSHFNSVNERTINQTDFTSINIGTSSYSRSMFFSATKYEFDNVLATGSDGKILGDVAYKFQYTSSMMVVTMDSKEKTKIDRYYTADNDEKVKKVGITWEIPQIKSKDDFVYTNERFYTKNNKEKSVEWANKLYGKDCLQWNNGEQVRFNVNDNKLIINFNDVTDFNAVEHYRIKVKYLDKNDETIVTKNYDYMSHYYKYEDNPHTYNFVIKDIPQANKYEVTVTAYDFFDNPSAKPLFATEICASLSFPEEIDLQAINTYSNLSKIVNYKDVAQGSNSSIQYYLKTIKKYSNGILLERVISDKSSDCLKDYLTITNWNNPTLVLKVKNTNDYDIDLNLEIQTNNTSANGDIKCKKMISKNSDFVTVEWNLRELFNLTSNSISSLCIKAYIPDSVVDIENGYEFNLIIDDIDVIER